MSLQAARHACSIRTLIACGCAFRIAIDAPIG
jgi:hypothetical protein